MGYLYPTIATGFPRDPVLNWELTLLRAPGAARAVIHFKHWHPLAFVRLRKKRHLVHAVTLCYTCEISMALSNLHSYEGRKAEMQDRTKFRVKFTFSRPITDARLTTLVLRNQHLSSIKKRGVTGIFNPSYHYSISPALGTSAGHLK